MAPRNPKKQKSKITVASRRPVIRKSRSSRPKASRGPRAMDAYLRLLADPCGADLTAPPYSGADTGYMIRVTDTIRPGAGGLSGGVAGNGTTLDGMVTFTPGNVSGSTGNISCFGGTGTTLTTVQAGFANFITQGMVAKFRPVAACLKFVPSGPYANRQGVVGMAYSTGIPYNVPTTLSAAVALSGATRVNGTGSTPHEVRWMPTSSDESFNIGGGSGGGSLSIILSGVDATFTTGTTANINGYFEYTAVYEWVPQLTGTNSTGVTMAPKAPLPFTTQDVLATIREPSRLIFDGVVSGLTSAAKNVAIGLLTNGVRTMTDRQSSMPMRLTY